MELYLIISAIVILSILLILVILLLLKKPKYNEKPMEEELNKLALRLDTLQSGMQTNIVTGISEYLKTSSENQSAQMRNLTSNVNEQMQKLYSSLGEMKTLATDMSDLKKVLSNVKTRGVFGEMQLDRILEQTMSTEQYSKNVKTKDKSDAIVEFAIKIPSKSDDGKIIWLPIDAKFHMDVYIKFCDACESGEKDLIDKASKEIASNIKLDAKNIHERYIDPPNTTDFAIMFLPTESLYAEVVKNTSLMEMINRDYNVTVAGPSTITALLNSLQMGFRTLAIEKRSSEVWKLLGAVKYEFEKFEEAIIKVQNHIDSADKVLNDTVRKKTKKINGKLRNVQTAPQAEYEIMMGADDETDDLS